MRSGKRVAERGCWCLVLHYVPLQTSGGGQRTSVEIVKGLDACPGSVQHTLGRQDPDKFDMAAAAAMSNLNTGYQGAPGELSRLNSGGTTTRGLSPRLTDTRC